MRVVIRSRIGNTTLALLGLLYVVSASATLTYYIVTNWGANHMTDFVLQAALVAAAIGGVFFVLIAAENLKLRRRDSVERSHSPRDRQTAAAGAS